MALQDDRFALVGKFHFFDAPLGIAQQGLSQTAKEGKLLATTQGMEAPAGTWGKAQIQGYPLSGLAG